MTTPPTPEQIWIESRRRLIPGTVIGSVIEWYDIAVYGQAAALVFGTLFFPTFSGPRAWSPPSPPSGSVTSHDRWVRSCSVTSVTAMGDASPWCAPSC